MLFFSEFTLRIEDFITSTLTDQFEKSYTDTKHLDKSSEVGLQKHVVWENACFGRFHRYGMLRNWCLIFKISGKG